MAGLRGRDFNGLLNSDRATVSLATRKVAPLHGKHTMLLPFSGMFFIYKALFLPGAFRLHANVSLATRKGAPLHGTHKILRPFSGMSFMYKALFSPGAFRLHANQSAQSIGMAAPFFSMTCLALALMPITDFFTVFLCVRRAVRRSRLQ